MDGIFRNDSRATEPHSRKMRLTVLILALVSVVQAQKVRFNLADRSVVLDRLAPTPATEEQRGARLQELFRNAGCKPAAITEQKVDGLQGANIVCRLAGKTDETIIVGANYGIGDPDDWSSAALLPSIYQALTIKKRHHTFLFVAFADQRRTLAGSRFFVSSMSQSDAEHTEAMIDLDELGLSPTKISSQGSDAALIKDLFTMAYTLRMTASQVDLTKTFSTDSESFSSKNIPFITIHSFALAEGSDVQTHELLEARQFRPDFYYNSYRLISGYLAFLDEKLRRRRHKR